MCIIVVIQVEFVCELLNVRDPGMLSRGIRPNDRRKLETALKGVNVEVTHRKSNRSVSRNNQRARLVRSGLLTAKFQRVESRQEYAVAACCVCVCVLVYFPLTRVSTPLLLPASAFCLIPFPPPPHHGVYQCRQAKSVLDTR